MRDKSDRFTRELPAFASGTLVTQNEASRLVESGLVMDFRIARFDGDESIGLRSGWLLHCVGASDRFVTLRAVKSDEFRVFRSLDAAVSMATAIGFTVTELGRPLPF